ncbi:glycosyltransferase [Thermoproteota archaeon]
MKLFIIHASAGSGHKKIAEAISGYAFERYGSQDVSILDVLDFTSLPFKFLYSKGYIFVISHMNWLWNILFFLADTPCLKVINQYFRYLINKVLCRRFIKYIESEKPDVILSTHFLVNELVSMMKERKLKNTKLISVITDFGVHNFWIAKNVDYFCVASDKTRQILISKGVNESKIKVVGIPTRKQFHKELDKGQIKNRLSISEDDFTVLILTGGIGIGPIYEVISLLEDRVNIIAICGNNKQLYSRLESLNFKKLKVLGWIDYIQEVMKASDVAITKPGGSTISECLVMDLPMIFFSIIPGQEFQNSQLISQLGLGMVIKNPAEIKEKILKLKDYPQELNDTKQRINDFKMADSSERILDLIDEK